MQHLQGTGVCPVQPCGARLGATYSGAVGMGLGLWPGESLLRAWHGAQCSSCLSRAALVQLSASCVCRLL